MKSIGRVIIIVGVIIVIIGVIFSLQSISVVGPSSSFMYDNPQWTNNGSVIIAGGIIIIAFGSGFILYRNTRREEMKK
jgi:hypothetical protein